MSNVPTQLGCDHHHIQTEAAAMISKTFLTPFPTRLCQVMYCHGDQSYPRPLGMGLNTDALAQNFSD